MGGRVLLVTSGFPPAMSADMQRARMLCNDIRKWGWDVEVLVPGLGFQRHDAIEEASRALRPEGVRVHEALPWQAWVFRMIRSRTIGWRALFPLYRMGSRVLADRRFDLIYLSTTAFPLFCLGRLWEQRFGVPYVLDFQDPWYCPYASYATTKQTLKAGMSRRIARFLEKWVLRRAAGVVSVSPDYLEQLAERYPGFAAVKKARCAVIPFGATELDISAALAAPPSDSLLKRADTLDIVYTGAGGAIMAKSFGRIVRALVKLRHAYPQLVDRLRIRLFGTNSDWQEGDPRSLQQLAEALGLPGIVQEFPQRIGYLEALGHALKADALLILGVDDRAYMPSKLFTYALTRKPILASLHAQSPANRYFEKHAALGYLIRFASDGGPQDVAEDSSVHRFVLDAAQGRIMERAAELTAYLSLNAARQHAELFDVCARPAQA